MTVKSSQDSQRSISHGRLQSLEFLQLFAGHLGGQREIFPVANHLGLALLTEDEPQKLPDHRLHPGPRFDVGIEIRLVVERIRPVLDGLQSMSTYDAPSFPATA